MLVNRKSPYSMSSVVYYQFRSSKQPQRLTFDGTGISVFDVKRGILLVQKLDSTADTFQLILSNPDTREEYTDDSEVLPRSTLVEARRLPLMKAGTHGAASQYVSGSLAITAKNASRRENFRNIGINSRQDGADMLSSAVGGGSEQDMMNMMFAEQQDQWSQTQQEMATKSKVYTPRPQVSTESDKTLPPGYICHRCGQKGHWITQCPSIYDHTWETKKVLRTTGIPKSMLRTISSSSMDPDSDDLDGKAYLMNAEGEYVVAVADDKSWEAFQARQLLQHAKAKRQIPENLQDPITHGLIRNPRKMPCCGKTYSEETIESALIQTDFKCPNCHKEEVYIDQLQVNKELQVKLDEYSNEDKDTTEKPLTDSKKAEEDSESDIEYSPSGPRKRRHSASSTASDMSDSSVTSLKRTKEGTPKPPALDQDMVNLKIMPPVFNPFLTAMTNPQNSQAWEEDSDFEIGDERPIVGRIR